MPALRRNFTEQEERQVGTNSHAVHNSLDQLHMSTVHEVQPGCHCTCGGDSLSHQLISIRACGCLR